MKIKSNCSLFCPSSLRKVIASPDKYINKQSSWIKNRSESSNLNFDKAVKAQLIIKYNTSKRTPAPSPVTHTQCYRLYYTTEDSFCVSLLIVLVLFGFSDLLAYFVLWHTQIHDILQIVKTYTAHILYTRTKTHVQTHMHTHTLIYTHTWIFNYHHRHHHASSPPSSSSSLS